MKRAKVWECSAAMVYDLGNLYQAHLNAKKGKSFYTEVKEVESNLGKYLIDLQELEKSGNYKTSKYEMFEKQDGKKLRKIYKLPYYPDRIHQWAIIQVIEPVLLRYMTDDTYSAIPGRGVELARKRIVKALNNDYEGTTWCLKIDIEKYYPNIDRQVLKNQYTKLFKDKELLAMLFEIIDSFDGDVGVPIGNYISQYSGNLYLSCFDHYVKEKLKVKHYFRYMDDMVFFGSSKEEMQCILKKVKHYLKTYLHLHVKDSWSLFRVEDRGVDFIGYVFFHFKTRLRKDIVKSIRKVKKRILRRANKGQMINYRLYCSMNSFYGWLNKSDSGGVWLYNVSIVEPYLDQYYDLVIAPRKAKR